MLFASIVIDLGLLRNNRQILVNAVDVGALAGGTLMPVDGCSDAPTQSATDSCANHGGQGQTNVDEVFALIREAVQRTYPGITEDTNPANGIVGYHISFRCLVGINTSGAPHISRDIPTACNPRRAGSLANTPAADHNVTAADFKGAGATRWSYCYPDLGDKCNVVRIEGVTNTNYSFGRVVGVNSGSTGATVSAACNGPCGQPPAAPVDLVVIVDRTASMSSGQIADARDAAEAVLGVYDPSLQRIAFGLLGPSFPNSTCSGGGGGPAVAVNAINSNSPSAPSRQATSTASNASAGANNIQIARPSGVSNNDVLVAGIAVQGGSGINVTAPSGWSLILRTNNSTNLSVLSYRKVITNAGSEPANYQWSLSPNARASGGIQRYTGVDNVNPIRASGGNTGNDTGSPFQPQAPSIATVVDDVELIAFTAILNASGGSGGYFTNWSNSMGERWDIRGTNAVGPSIAAGSKTDTSAGNSNATTSDATGGGQWAAQHVALNPDFTNHYGTDETLASDRAKWIPIGFTSTDSDLPAQTWNEAYVDVNGNLDNTTHLVSAINCFNFPGGTGTNLTTPIEMAAYYLEHFGRPNVKWGILLETDGQPSYSSTGDSGNYTCQSAVTAATNAKAITNANGDHIEIFTVGFLPSGDPDCPDTSGTYDNQNVTRALADMASTNLSPSPNGSSDGCTAAGENTDQDHFFCNPDSADLEETFTTIATEFAGVRSHLIQLSPPPSVNSLSPANGPPGGGTIITVNGKYFTGSSSVTWNGVSIAFSVLSDTQIRITAPAGASAATRQVIVTNDGGSSLPHSGSQYTYN